MRYEWTDALTRTTCYIDAPGSHPLWGVVDIEAPPGRLPLACELLRVVGSYDRLLAEAKDDAHKAEVARDLASDRIAALEEENRRLLAAMPTADELTALKQSLEGWRNIQETCGKGHYFADGWGGRQLAALLEKLTPPGSAA